MAIYWRPWELAGGMALVAAGAVLITLYFRSGPMFNPSLSWLGGLLLAMGAALIGIGVGRWERPGRGPSETSSR